MTKPLPDPIRAQIHAQLAALERAGMPVADAVALLRLPRAQDRVAGVVRALRQGESLADAGARAGLFNPLETTVLRAAILGGSPADAHERLARSAAASARRSGQLRTRLLMPLAVLAIALFVQPLPALISGSIGAGAYLMQSVGSLLLMAGCAVAAKELALRFHAGGDGPGRIASEQLLLRLPVIGDLLVRGQAQTFFESLGLLLGCGVPMFSALPAATATMSVRTLRHQYEQLLPLMQAGMSLSNAARTLDCLGNPAVIGMIATGEGSGKLAELLTRYAQSEGKLVSERQEMLATWIPRIVYAVILSWMAYGLIGGAGEVFGRRID